MAPAQMRGPHTIRFIASDGSGTHEFTLLSNSFETEIYGPTRVTLELLPENFRSLSRALDAMSPATGTLITGPDIGNGWTRTASAVTEGGHYKVHKVHYRGEFIGYADDQAAARRLARSCEFFWETRMAEITAPFRRDT